MERGRDANSRDPQLDVRQDGISAQRRALMRSRHHGDPTQEPTAVSSVRRLSSAFLEAELELEPSPGELALFAVVEDEVVGVVSAVMLNSAG